MPDRGEGKDACASTDLGVSGHHDVAHQLHAVGKRNRRPDVAEGSDAHAVSERGTVLDDGGAVNLRLA